MIATAQLTATMCAGCCDSHTSRSSVIAPMDHFRGSGLDARFHGGDTRAHFSHDPRETRHRRVGRSVPRRGDTSTGRSDSCGLEPHARAPSRVARVARSSSLTVARARGVHELRLALRHRSSPASVVRSGDRPPPGGRLQRAAGLPYGRSTARSRRRSNSAGLPDGRTGSLPPRGMGH